MLKSLMMIFLLITSCSQLPKNKVQEIVSLDAALNQAQMSYLRGCVEASKDQIPAAFEGCRGKAIFHRKELDGIIFQETDP